jgi:DNA-binding transcriptional MerR regulator
MNSEMDQQLYRPSDFARRTGVTVRALHYYDQVGLLRPRARSAAGYRLYGPPDFARLQQVVTLKFIGFRLREIKKLLAGTNLAAALRLQTKALEQKRRQLDGAIAAITHAERLLGGRATPDWEAFAKTIEAIQMQTNNDWIRKYYNDEAQKLLAKRSKLWSPQLQQQTEKDWAGLLRDIEEAARKQVDPAGAAGQALAERHAKLIEGFTGGHAAIRQGLTRLWKDRANWPPALEKKIFEPFARQGVTPARCKNPRFLSEPASRFLGKALKARWVRTYFNSEAQGLLARREGPFSAKLQHRWARLRKAIEKATQDKVDPAGPRARALTKRHAALIHDLTGGQPSIRVGLARIWKDRANWPSEFLSEAGARFLKAALAAKKSANRIASARKS